MVIALGQLHPIWQIFAMKLKSLAQLWQRCILAGQIKFAAVQDVVNMAKMANNTKPLTESLVWLLDPRMKEFYDTKEGTTVVICQAHKLQNWRQRVIPRPEAAGKMDPEVMDGGMKVLLFVPESELETVQKCWPTRALSQARTRQSYEAFWRQNL